MSSPAFRDLQVAPQPTEAASSTSPDTTTNASTGGAEQPVDNSQESVWAPFVRVVIGLGIVIAALTWSQHLDGGIDRFGYVPTMLVYLIVMIIGGGTMVSGAKTLWSRLTTAT